ncbi:formimidoylglutamase [Arthrobacter woluwensis]|uniref:Formimidoylglutamase n=1 Tax=Arthrobacter woluwensis TaxID=156980 RepID=A0A1H4JGJ6_9MICC|nr:formimidoylglutamase [Arthrobacter woluwensis]SEB45393.1 formiminoglutamase [Arthrobacter woluwensis]
MTLRAPSVDVPPQPWTGRHDGDGPEHARHWQRVHALPATADAGTAVGGAASAGRPAVVVGFASDAGVARNKGRVGAAAGPAAIRAALGPLAVHDGRVLADAGDIRVEGDRLEDGQARFGAAVAQLIDDGALTVGLGGGHEIAYASYRGVAGSAKVTGGARWGVLNLDAHFDLRDEENPSSGTPFLQMAHEEKALGRELHYAVLGISRPNNTRVLFDEADSLGVTYLLDEDCSREATEAFVREFVDGLDVVYLTIDLDVLPAAVAPGVSAPAAYGVPLEIINAVCRQVAASGKLLHVDVAELNPGFDIDGRTAKVAARLLDTILGAALTS